MVDSQFFLRNDVLSISRELLGKKLVTFLGGEKCVGKIVEVEAYSGRNDKACHAYNGKRTKRTEVMYLSGGRSYVYLCYGIHHLFNVVTNVEGSADAVLIRALEPLEGIDVMAERTNHNRWPTKGPGKMTKAMGIDMTMNNHLLNGHDIWIEEGDHKDMEIIATTRIGIDYAEEDALLSWRFYIKGNNWVSKM